MDNSNAPVFWSVLMERSIQELGVRSLLQIASVNGALGYKQIMTGYARTDVARNKIVKVFLEQTHDPNASLVMLDCDHNHPVDIVKRLTQYPDEIGVIGALAFRRGQPFDPCFYIRTEDGLVCPVDFGGVMKGAAVGTGAICIKRWVFEKLSASGWHYPYFRYEYGEGDEKYNADFPSEDMVFARACEDRGIAHWCDTSLITPHLTTAEIDQESWLQYLQDNPDEIPIVEIQSEVRNDS
jgi:hypothetical protein